MTRKNKSVPVWDPIKKEWRYRAYVDGKQRNFYSKIPGRKGETECYLKADDAESEAHAVNQNSTIGELWQRYEAHVKSYSGKNSRPYQAAVSFGKHHILPKCKHKKLSRMSTLDWQEIISDAKPVKRKYKSKAITTTETESGGLSAKTLRHLRAEISKFMKWCRQGNLTDITPELYIPKDAEKIERNDMTASEALTLMRTRISSNPALHAFRFQLLHGLRPGENLAINKDVDFEGDYLHIQRSLAEDGSFTSGKNFNANRYEYMHKLSKQIISDQEKCLKQQGIVSPWLFPMSNGEPMSQRMYRRNLKQYCKEAGMTEITPYRLRHGFISIMRGRIDEDTVKMIVGHSATMDTFGTYDSGMIENITEAGTKAGKVWEDLLTGS